MEAVYIFQGIITQSTSAFCCDLARSVSSSTKPKGKAFDVEGKAGIGRIGERLYA
jgi:hypothetical protein